jgi:sporulation protein YlmC with PRC-barrel domain
MQIYATELIGSETYDDQGHFVGRVREFFIEPAEQANRVSRFLLSRGRFAPLLARQRSGGAGGAGTIRLNCSERALEIYRPNEAWLAVRKDLLDQQIIDTKGGKWCA